MFLKKFFSFIGFFTIFVATFIYSEYTSMVVKEYDDIMIKIREEAPKQRKEKIEGVIDDGYFTPGINGFEVDIQKSYQNMRKIGVYSEKYLIYKDIKVIDSIKNNCQKKIKTANTKKNMVGFIFLVKEDDDITNILYKLKNNNITATFFLDNNWIYDNEDLLYKIIDYKNDIGLLGDNNSYNNVDYFFLESKVDKIRKKDYGFCLTNISEYENCLVNNNLLIEPVIINNNYYVNLKKNLKSGLIIAFDVNSNMKEELQIMINYVKSKGLDISNLSNLLKE